MHIKNILLTILSFNLLVQSQYQYAVEYLNERVYEKCVDYPDNFLDLAFDLSDLSFQQNEDGEMLVNGAFTVKQSLPDKFDFKAETFKKQRGSWQSTIYTTKSDNLCKAINNPNEMWHIYWKSTPKEQQKCPFVEGQKVEIYVQSGTSVNMPMRNVEGEYLSRLEFGEKSKGIFMCANVFASVYKI